MKIYTLETEHDHGREVAHYHRRSDAVAASVDYVRARLHGLSGPDDDHPGEDARDWFDRTVAEHGLAAALGDVDDEFGPDISFRIDTAEVQVPEPVREVLISALDHHVEVMESLTESPTDDHALEADAAREALVALGEERVPYTLVARPEELGHRAMTVAELIVALARLPQELPVTFAHCEHFLLDVHDAYLIDGAPAIVSIGWTDDCSCDDE